MTLEEIKTAVDAGNRVHWVNSGYVVTRDDLGQYFITFMRNGSAIGLTGQDGTLLNGEPDEFFIEESAADCHEVL
ncbi:hypothetical protein [Ruegeria sp. HKCCD7318]|uniref:hypothetical protein n=1 Tax=Ruegeria sp. HKCCD7318 TaxID=2683014 RepID=UPI0014917A7B|nr:hypothetical protein [Ruegeria sp. HKCCD7318]